MSNHVLPLAGNGPSGPRVPGAGPGGRDAAGQQPGGPDPRQLLFTGGPRLGWSFRDHHELVPAYPEPKPGPQAIQAASDARTGSAEARLARAWTWAGKPSIGLALVLVLVAACARTTGRGGFSPLLALIAGIIVCAAGLGYTAWCWRERDKARDILPEQLYQQAVSGWEQRAASHRTSETARLAGGPEWGSADVPPRRTDIFGGTLAGWEALLAVHGASLIGARRPLLIADLTGLQPAAPLFALDRAAGITPVTWQLPADLGRSGIMASLAPPQIASAIAEALHAGAPGGTRTERALDTSILHELAAALAPGGVTLSRLAAAVRAACGQDPGTFLTAAEHQAVTAEVFPPGPARDQAAPGLARLNAVLPGLAAAAGEEWPARPAACTCLTVGTGTHDAGTEILAALLIQWVTGMVRAVPGVVPAVIVAGADQATGTMLEQLTDACDLRGTPVTLLFRHLRDDAVALLGGAAATAFMRLGNHHEAEQAAGYLGRHHTFAVSSFTATRGASTTRTTGGGTGDSASDSRNRGWQASGYFGTPGSRSGGATRTTGTSTSRNWSAADGTNWSDTHGAQRVYEYRVEPSVLQDLPELSLLLADRGPGTLLLRAAECDPSIVTLRGVSADPLPVLPQPGPAAVGTQAAVSSSSITGPDPGTPALDPAVTTRPAWAQRSQPRTPPRRPPGPNA